MTYDPCDPVGSLTQHYHDQRRAAARTVVQHCGAGADGRLVLEMLGLFDASLSGDEPPVGLRRELTGKIPAFVE